MTPSHLLVIKPSSLGDVVHTLPAVAALRARFPGARITWLVNPEWAPLLQGNPHIDDTLIFPRREFRGLGGLLRFNQWRSQLPQKIAPDLILDFMGLLRSALVGSAFRGAPLYGMSDAREGARFFQTRSARVDRSMHAVERYLALAAAAGAKAETPVRFALPAGSAPATSLPSEPFVLLHPFSRGRGKSLSAEAVLAFCRTIGHPVVLAGRSTTSFPSIPDNVTNLLNRTSLPELIWLLRRAAFVVSVDSGPMHLAAVVTGQLLGIHTWSDPCRVGPYHPGAHVWKNGKFFPALDPASSFGGGRTADRMDAEIIAQRVRDLMGA